jgi:hypothetical protein
LLPHTIFENVSELFSLLLHQLKEDFLMGHQVVDQLLRLMLFSKLFNFNVSSSGIWQLENIWLEIGKTMLQELGSQTENVGTINQIDLLAMEYLNKLNTITSDMQKFKISAT